MLAVVEKTLGWNGTFGDLAEYRRLNSEIRELKYILSANLKSDNWTESYSTITKIEAADNLRALHESLLYPKSNRIHSELFQSAHSYFERNNKNGMILMIEEAVNNHDYQKAKEVLIYLALKENHQISLNEIKQHISNGRYKDALKEIASCETMPKVQLSAREYFEKLLLNRSKPSDPEKYAKQMALEAIDFLDLKSAKLWVSAALSYKVVTQVADDLIASIRSMASMVDCFERKASAPFGIEDEELAIQIAELGASFEDKIKRIAHGDKEILNLLFKIIIDEVEPDTINKACRGLALGA